jgi:16S rRNA (uracil1498-N3)-methyltransferase
VIEGSAPTVLVAGEVFAGDQLVVVDDVYHHLFRVRRLAVGDQLRVVDGLGRARAGMVASIERKRALVDLGRDLPSREVAREVTLYCAFPRPERAAWLVEKATELGVATLAFVRAERSGPPPPDAALARLRRVAVAALEQCGRARLPAITGSLSWEQLPVGFAGASFVLDLPAVPTAPEELPLAAEDPPMATGSAGKGQDRALELAPVSLLVGPEGGFTARERSWLASSGWRTWSLGGQVLRLETAAVAALAQLLTAAPPRSSALGHTAPATPAARGPATTAAEEPG